ncbi:TPA: hypothetical protein SMR96_000989 [Proteus mirabilis]|uniref:hypothetical protein n=1 Tax=Proteus mirabilis TaxID=584 RepID=UPI00147C4601|nr:hypothetical protein [Proteus mirabilis]EKY1726119.1 hypothetical protein [Proteus mirabilis]ELA7948672.1 hypothetical protein [Proteus mirabilis]MBG3017057.1 hypothetical protein [Proteus mirabilis]MBG3049041.1 hypothetical protein [Proteus mirabilis]MBI6269151.1 hypothetical protein [Proteus mirabilis]
MANTTNTANAISSIIKAVANSFQLNSDVASTVQSYNPKPVSRMREDPSQLELNTANK